MNLKRIADTQIDQISSLEDQLLELIVNEEYAKVHELWDSIPENILDRVEQELVWSLAPLEINQLIPSHLLDKLKSGQL